MSGGTGAAGRARPAFEGVVVSVLAPDLAALADTAREAFEAAGDARADLVELRLDLVPDATEAELAHVIAPLARPVIAAIHGPEGFPAPGAPAADSAARLALLGRAARAGAALVDVDATLLPALQADPDALPAGTRRVLSVHPPAGASLDAAALDRLAAPLDAAAREGLDVVKVVPHAADAEDALDVLRWAARRRARGAPPTAAFCTGPAGAATRALAPAYGAALVYAAPAARERAPTAPGQVRVDVLRAAWPAGSDGGGRAPTAATALLGIAGRPLAHSASPAVHAAAQRALGLDAVFVRLEARGMEGLLARLVGGDGPRWRGLSVTAPFKTEALALAASADAEACALGAANTLVRRGDGWHASNTDAPAVAAALEAAGAALDGALAVVIGAGGAARAAASMLAARGARVTVAARRPEAAEALAAQLGAELGTGRVEGVGLDGLEAHVAAGGRAPSIVVHATPAGTFGRGVAPVPPALLGPGVHVLDAVYAPARTGLLRRAALAGATTIAGTAWFLAQARAQLARLHAAGDAPADAPTDAGPAGPAGRPATTPPGPELEAALAEHLAAVAPPELVVLIGLRGAGKSTVGRALAARLGGDFTDLDARVAAAAGAASAGAHLADVGEPAFRAAEGRALASFLEEAASRPREEGAGRPAVLATGGGVVEGAGARALLADPGLVARILWLDVPVEALGRRLESSSELRPSLTGAPPAEELGALLARRRRAYAALADATLDGARPPDEVVERAVRAVRGTLETGAMIDR